MKKSFNNSIQNAGYIIFQTLFLPYYRSSENNFCTGLFLFKVLKQQSAKSCLCPQYFHGPHQDSDQPTTLNTSDLTVSLCIMLFSDHNYRTKAQKGNSTSFSKECRGLSIVSLKNTQVSQLFNIHQSSKYSNSKLINT